MTLVIVHIVYMSFSWASWRCHPVKAGETGARGRTIQWPKCPKVVGFINHSDYSPGAPMFWTELVILQVTNSRLRFPFWSALWSRGNIYCKKPGSLISLFFGYQLFINVKKRRKMLKKWRILLETNECSNKKLLFLKVDCIDLLYWRT